MADLLKRIAEYAPYLALRVVGMFVRMFDVESVYRTAGKIANIWYLLDARHRKRAVQHLRDSFPDWSEQKIDRTARGSLRSMGYLAVEVLLTTRLVTYWRWRRHVIPKNCSEAIRVLLERESGLVCISGHFGGWEVGGYAMAALGFEGYAVARPLDNPYLNEYLMSSRQKMGLKILDKRGATEVMDDIFARRSCVGFIADQDAGPTGIFVDFLGRAASTYKAPALMAMRYQAPIAVICTQRMKDSYLFQIASERMIYPTSALERAIRRCPEQYLWTYRRWKTRPKHESAVQDVSVPVATDPRSEY